jgi:hypothetical protein
MSSAISWFFSAEEFGVILEEDVRVAPDFFELCALLKLKGPPPNVYGINAHYPENDVLKWRSILHTTKAVFPWGWASWRECWQVYDGELTGWNSVVLGKKLKICRVATGSWVASLYFLRVLKMVEQRKVHSWAYPWLISVWLRDGVFLTPAFNLAQNVGFASNATNTSREASTFRRLLIAESVERVPTERDCIHSRDSRRDARLLDQHFRARSLSRLLKVTVSVLLPLNVFRAARGFLR